MTTTVGIALVKDERDVIEGTLRHMADEVDQLFVVDNGSTDGTRELVRDLADEGPVPILLLDDPTVGYHQSDKMSRLANMVADVNGTEALTGDLWIVPFDADEIWYSRIDRISAVLAAVPANVNAAEATLFNHFATSVDDPDPDPFRSMVWRQRMSAPLHKVAFRWEPGAVIAQGNHSVALPSAAVWSPPVLTVRHFPYRSPDQFITKARNGAAAYRATDLPLSEGAHWRAYGDILDRHGPEALAGVYREHFYYLSPTDSGLIRDPAPYRRWTGKAQPDNGSEQR